MAQRARLSERVAEAVEAQRQLQADAEIARLRAEIADVRSRYKAALTEADRQRERAESLVMLSGVKPAKKKAAAKARRSKLNPATALLMVSDVHCEERVRPETVNGENDYTLDVCDQRMSEIEERFLSCLDHERQIANVDRVVVWLGGDFISGHIHPDCVEVAQLSPTNATRWIAERLRRMVDVIAAHAAEVVIATNAGNHGRSTEKQRIATELDHSYEQMMFHMLRKEERNANVNWRIAEGHLGYIDLDGFSVRHLHGHSIRYAGGVLGLALPASKAIAAWDAHRRADLTIFGHYHQWAWVRGARYISNGSVIGHSPYGTFVKVSPERPCQGLAIIDHSRNEVTRAYPLFCDRDLREKE